MFAFSNKIHAFKNALNPTVIRFRIVPSMSGDLSVDDGTEADAVVNVTLLSAPRALRTNLVGYTRL